MTDPTLQKDQQNESLQPDASRPDQFFLISFAGVLTFMALVAALALLLLFSRTGETFLTIRDDSVGEVLMRRGDRLNKTAYKKEALACYEKALKARFAGAQNRTHSLEAAGLILWHFGEEKKAREYLEASLAGPEATTAPYEALVDIHLKAGRVEAAGKVLEQWLQTEADPDGPSEEMKILLASAKIAQAQGREEEARTLFKAGAEEGKDPAFSACLAQNYARAGEHEKALSSLEVYFLQGGDEQMRSMRQLYRTLKSGGMPTGS
ncbi:MAG: hypothetical protein GX130_02880 [Candidatus Hydrogenedens sp.]|nr:hypothetical protein [Candidatus Hydrogenedens sp.]